MRPIILLLFISATAFGQCGAAGTLIINPITGLFDCTAVAGAGLGSVTSVGLVGTANQITITGASPITASGSWTVSLPAGGVTLPGTTTGATTTQSPSDNSTKLASTAYVDAAVAAGGGGAFSGLTSGTNTTAAMVIGTGASLLPAALTGVAFLTAGVPSVATGTCNSSTVVGGDGACVSVSSAYTAITGVPANSLLGNNTGSTANAISLTALPFVVTAATGGTGVANTGTITLSGNVVTTGAFDLKIASVDSLVKTMPTGTVTIASLTGAEALTNKTYNGNTWTAGTGVLTIAAAKTLTANASITLAGTDSTTMTFPTTTATIARTDAAQTFTGLQTYGSGTGILIKEIDFGIATNNVYMDNRNSTTSLYFGSSATDQAAVTTANTGGARLALKALGSFSWSSTSDPIITADTNLSRVSAGVVGVGTGAQASVAGSLSMATITIANSSFSFNGHTCTIVSTVVTCP